MTWFLKYAAAAPGPDAPAVTGPIPTWGEQFHGQATDARARQDSWGSADQYRNEVTNELSRALAPDGRLVVPPADQREYQDPRTRGHYLARRIDALRPGDTAGRFKDLPSEADLDGEIIRRRDRDMEENQAMLDRGDSWSAKLAGNFWAGSTDPWNIATIGIGGPGGAGLKAAARYIGVQAALGAATELPGVIKEQSVAKDLGFTPEDPATAVATAAVGGAVLGGAIHGAGRLIEYARGKRAAANAARPAGVAGVDHEDAVAEADHALRTGQDPRPGPAPAGPIGDDYFAAIRQTESSGDDAARATTSSATGRYQFIDSTWRGLMRDHPQLGLTIDGRLDPAQQEKAIRAFTADNAAVLARSGVPATNGNLYAAHFLGAQRAARVLASRADARLTDILPPDVIRANRHLKDMTVADFNAWTARHSGGRGGAAAVVEQPAGVAEGWPAGSEPALPMRAPNSFDQVTTPAGTSVDVEYRVVDLGDLRAAAGDLQPRDRSRASSDEQIAEIAANLDPRRLMRSAEADRGAPVVGDDMVVESGNGRIAALRRAATEHPDRYDAYVQALRDEGYAVPEGVRQPALVAVRRTAMDMDARRAFVRENNTSGIARMSATEQAATNADYLTQHAWDAYRPGARLGGPENTEFLRRVFAAMPQAERGPFVSHEGRLTTDGLRMVRQATFHRAFPADDLLRLLAETENPALSGMLRMMEDVAPDWAAFRAAVDAGYVRAEFDITEPLLDMVRQIARARVDGRDGQSVIAALRDALSTADMFTARDPDMTEALIGAFYKGDRARPAEATQTILQRYIAEAQAAGRADSADMFGEGVTPAQVLTRAVEQQDARAPMPAMAGPSDAVAGPAGEIGDLRGQSGDIAPEGASSPMLIRSTDAGLREMRDAPEIGPFGPVLHGYEGRWKEAIEELTARQTGDAIGALDHPHTGPIDLVWGEAGKDKDGYGLAKIIRKHPEVVDSLQDRLSAATEVLSESRNRVRLGNGRDVFVVRHDFEGQQKRWLLTAFERSDAENDAAQRIVDRRTGRADELPEGSSPSAPLQNEDNAAAPRDQANDPQFLRTSNEPEDDIDAALVEARAAFADTPDLEIRLGDGPDAPVHSLSEILNDLDRKQELLDRMNSCSLKGTPR